VIESVGDADKVPLEIVLLFDVSASTDAMFTFQQETAAKFLRDVMRPKDRAAVFTVGAAPKMIQPFGSAEAATASVKAIVPTKEQTAFYDSVGAAVSYLRNNSPEGRRRVVVVISDGEDTNSEGVLKAIWNAERKIADNVQGQELRNIRVRARDSAKASEQNKILKGLQDADAVFYSINPAGSSYLLNQMSVFGQSNMQRFATETGGAAFLPKFLPIDTKDGLQNQSNMRKNTAVLEGIFRQLANELQAQYLVQYYSDGEYPNNRYVKLNVALQDPANRRLRAREGYFVKN
jgi:Ca-activated chloride channel family protein